MSSLQKLLQTLRSLVELERELVDLDRQIIVGVDRPAKTPKKKRSRRVAAAHGERFEYLLPMLRALRDAAEPLPPREIAALLGITPKITSQRLVRAMKLGYVERVGNARYRVTDSVRSVPGL